MLMRQVFFPKAETLTPVTKPVWELFGKQLCERAFRTTLGLTKRAFKGVETTFPDWGYGPTDRDQTAED